MRVHRLRAKHPRALVVAAVVPVVLLTLGLVELSRPDPLFPPLGTEIGVDTRSCAQSAIDGTPVTGAECAAWDQAGPINAVVVFNNRDPFAELVKGTKWTPASGNWLVMQGHTNEGFKGCSAGWRDDTQQAQLRLDPITRRHWKMIYEACTQSDGSTAIFGQVHTDKYDIKKCGGDYAIDWDQARDALADAFSKLPDVTVTYRNVTSRKRFHAGCHTEVPTDGNAVFISLEDR